MGRSDLSSKVNFENWMVPGESLCPGGSEFTYDRLLGTHIYCIFETEPND